MLNNLVMNDYITLLELCVILVKIKGTMRSWNMIYIAQLSLHNHLLQSVQFYTKKIERFILSSCRQKL